MKGEAKKKSIYDYVPPLDERRRRIVDEILKIKEPPVARMRLLSRGIEPYHRLYLVSEDVTGDKSCIGCGNCIDSCPVLRKFPERLDESQQRTSFTLEALVGEDCEQCYACVLACPQVDTEIKDHIVDDLIVEVIPPAPRLSALDRYFMAAIALLLGVAIGIFIAW